MGRNSPQYAKMTGWELLRRGHVQDWDTNALTD